MFDSLFLLNPASMDAGAARPLQTGAAGGAFADALSMRVRDLPPAEAQMPGQELPAPGDELPVTPLPRAESPQDFPAVQPTLPWSTGDLQGSSVSQAAAAVVSNAERHEAVGPLPNALGRLGPEPITDAPREVWVAARPVPVGPTPVSVPIAVPNPAPTAAPVATPNAASGAARSTTPTLQTPAGLQVSDHTVRLAADRLVGPAAGSAGGSPVERTAGPAGSPAGSIERVPPAELAPSASQLSQRPPDPGARGSAYGATVREGVHALNLEATAMAARSTDAASARMNTPGPGAVETVEVERAVQPTALATRRRTVVSAESRAPGRSDHENPSSRIEVSPLQRARLESGIRPAQPVSAGIAVARPAAPAGRQDVTDGRRGDLRLLKTAPGPILARAESLALAENLQGTASGQILQVRSAGQGQDPGGMTAGNAAATRGPAPGIAMDSAVAAPAASPTQGAETSPGQPTARAAHPESLLAADQQLPAQLAQRVLNSAAQNLSHLRIQLHPLELGQLDIQFKLHAEQLELTFTAHQGATRDLIESYLPNLRALLSDSGIQLGDVEIKQGSGGRQETGEGPADHNAGTPAAPADHGDDVNPDELPRHADGTGVTQGRIIDAFA